MEGVSGQIEGGQLLLPEEAPWLAEFKTELVGFPNARHDDQADALSQLMNWVLKRQEWDFLRPLGAAPMVCINGQWFDGGVLEPGYRPYDMLDPWGGL